MLNAPNAESERRTLSTYLLQNTWYCFRASASPDCWHPHSHSPTKETDSDAARLLNWDDGACRTMVSWARTGEAVWLLAEWPWPSCLSSQQFNVPTSPQRDPASSFPPTEENLMLMTFVQHMPSIKRVCQSCKSFSRLISPTHIVFDWKHLKNMQWTCPDFPMLCPAPSGSQQSGDQAGIWKISILVLHWDTKTPPQSDWGTSVFNGCGQIIYNSIQEQNYVQEGVEVHYVVLCKGNHRNAPLLTENSNCSRLKILPIIWIYSYYLLCLQLPVTC